MTGAVTTYQRYYASSYGRFNTADQYMASAGPSDPGSWNRYAYVGGDPINKLDPQGLIEMDAQQCIDDPESCEANDWGSAGSGYSSGSGGEGVAGICSTNPTWAVEHAAACGDPTSAPFTQGNGANNFINVTNLSTTSVQAIIVQNDLRWLQQAISQDPTCDGWLQGSYAAIDYMLDAPGSGATMMAVGVGNFPTGTNAVASISGTNLPTGMLITVALNGAFFQTGASPGFGLPSWVTAGSNADQAEILLHELAHDLGVASMQPDGPLPNGQPNVNAQTMNNQAVMTKCGGVVARAAGMN